MNYIITYTKLSGTIVDVSIYSNSFKELINLLIKSLTVGEFNSITQIRSDEPLSFG